MCAIIRYSCERVKVFSVVLFYSYGLVKVFSVTEGQALCSFTSRNTAPSSGGVIPLSNSISALAFLPPDAFGNRSRYVCIIFICMYICAYDPLLMIFNNMCIHEICITLYYYVYLNGNYHGRLIRQGA